MPEGPFLSFLDWINTASEVPLNLIAGRPSAAFRRGVDFLSSVPDAVLPGEWIPSASTDEDRITASEAFGIDPWQHPGLAKAVDIVGGTAVNPITYLGIRGGSVRAGLPFTQGSEIPGSAAALSKAGELAKKGVSAIPGSEATGDLLRRTFNYLDVPAEGEELISRATGTGQQVGRLGEERLKQIYQGVRPEESGAIGDILERIDRTAPDRKDWRVIGDIDEYLSRLPNVRPDVVKRVLDERRGLMETFWSEGQSTGVGGNIFGRGRQYVNDQGQTIPEQGLEKQWRQDISSGASPNVGLDEYATLRGFRPEPVRSQGIPDYFRREFSGFEDIQDPRMTSTSSGILKSRKEELGTPEQTLGLLQKYPELNLERDAMGVDLRRSAAQGRLSQKAAIGKQLTKKEDFALSNPEDRQAVRDIIDQMAKDPAQKDYAYKLKNLFDGVKPRGENWFSKGLHGANKLFKGAATFGVVVPRASFNFGNRLSGTLGQLVSNPEARKTILASAGRFPSDMVGAAKDGLIALREALEQFDSDFLKTIGSALPKRGARRSTLSQNLDDIETAYREAGGSAEKLRDILKNKQDGEALQQALDLGVLDNFVSTEDLLARMANNTAWAKTKDLMMWPASIAQGVEQRMRLGTFKDLLKDGKSPAEAAKIVKDTYLDYSIPGWENRTFRDVVPFGAFLSQNVKQQAKFIAEQPSVAVATSQLIGNDPGLPKYPWLEEQMAVPIGLDEQGNPQYISSFRMPIEGLAEIPGTSGQDIFSDVVGNLNPFIKTGISYAANRDPFTGREFGQYDKIMGQSAGELGRAYNIVMGTGLTQALGSPLKQAENLLDERKNALERSMQFLTGIRTVSVDPDVAERQRLEDYLQNRPDIRTAPSYYQTGEDPELSQVLKDLRAAKERLKQKRAAQAAL